MKGAKTQLFFIHGGDTHVSERDYQRWLRTRPITIEKKITWNTAYLDRALGRRVHIIRPRMPLQDNAKYPDWKICFERFFPMLKNNIILVGSSLGGMFLAKYLSENRFPRKILSAYLVCPPFDDTLRKERLAGGFRLKSDLSLLAKNAPKLTLLFSKNDDVVPYVHAAKYARKLPHAKVIAYNHIKGHFIVSKLPEIVRMIKKDIRLK